jgi:thiamine biosynthesis protein ThiS
VSNSPADSASSASIQIVVNGEPQAVPEGLKVDQLLAFLEIPASRVAVERNREIVRKAAWVETPVEPGDQLEIVWFVGGGRT